MAATPSVRTPRSAKIPQWSIEAVLPVVQALATLAGLATSARIAQQLGTSPAGGKYRSKVSSASYYGFIERKGATYMLTPRGEALVSGDEDAALGARREAVMSTTFGHIIRKFVGREPNEGAIAARLADDFGSPDASAAAQAETLVRAARDAELVSDGRFDAAAIESVPANIARADTETNDAEPRRRPTTASTPVKPGSEQRQESGKRRASEVTHRQEESGPFAPGIQLVLRIDAAGWTPEQVAELIQRLRDGRAAAQTPDS